jgi:hypothetical protein
MTRLPPRLLVLVAVAWMPHLFLEGIHSILRIASTARERQLRSLPAFGLKFTSWDLSSISRTPEPPHLGSPSQRRVVPPLPWAWLIEPV